MTESEISDADGAQPSDEANLTDSEGEALGETLDKEGNESDGDGDEKALPEFRTMQEAVIAAVVGLLLFSGAEKGVVALMIVVGVLQAALIAAWIVATRVPGRFGAAAVGVLAAAGADVAVTVATRSQLGGLLVVFGLAVPALFAHQLGRGGARSAVVDSLAKTAVLVVAPPALVALVQLRHEPSGGQVAAAVGAAAALALVVARLTDLALPIALFDVDVPRGFYGVILGGLAGGAVGQLLLSDNVDFVRGRAAFTGFAVGILVSLFSIGTGYLQRQGFLSLGNDSEGIWSERLRPVYAVLLPVCFVSPLGYLVCLAIRG